MSTGSGQRAHAPVAKLDFANQAAGAKLDTTAPQPRNHALARKGSIAVGGTVVAASRALVGESLKNTAVFSSADLVEQGNTRPLIPLGIDPPDHARFRKALDPLFSPRHVNAMDADITDRVNRFIDGFIDRGWCDFTAELAERFPASVFLGMMGLPWTELDTLTRMRDGILHPGERDSTPQQRSAVQRRTAQEVYAYFDDILDERALAPGDDILSHLATAHADTSALTRDEALSICFVLLTAGLDTVTDSLTCFWAHLAQHPERRHRIATDPDVIPSAVEELLRWETPVPGVVRWARQDHAVGDHTVAAGHHLMINLSAANLDPYEFDNPLEVHFDRPANRHLAFGGGPHRCLGSHLARRELRIALREWHRRIPEYTLAPGYEVRFKPPLRFVPDLQLVWPTEAGK